MNEDEFIAIDVETANADRSSICQIGIVFYRNGEIVDSYSTLVNPEDYFDGLNVSIHGIDEERVKNSPTFNEISSNIFSFLDNRVCVCHTSFDRTAIQQVFEKYNLTGPDSLWIDSAMVARRAWGKFRQRSYGLKNICDFLRYEFKHHDALEDAKASAHILLAALKVKNISLQEVTDIFKKKSKQRGLAELESVPLNDNGKFYGEVIVFTGTLNIPRVEAINKAKSVGFEVGEGVTKKTSVLVVGQQDLRRLKPGEEKSSKHVKAEKLIREGLNVEIISEETFLRMIQNDLKDAA